MSRSCEGEGTKYQGQIKRIQFSIFCVFDKRFMCYENGTPSTEKHSCWTVKSLKWIQAKNSDIILGV